MARPKSDVQARILDTVEKQLRRVGGGSLTLGTVATETGCAKGLVNYHFKTKGDLLAAAAKRMLHDREELWKAALKSEDPEVVFRQAWQLINAEVSGGFWKAWASFSASRYNMTVQAVNNGMESFSTSLAISVDALLRNMGLTPTITVDELGHLVGAAVQGFGMQLANGMSAQHVEGAHAALWVGILALTKRRRP